MRVSYFPYPQPRCSRAKIQRFHRKRDLFRDAAFHPALTLTFKTALAPTRYKSPMTLTYKFESEFRNGLTIFAMLFAAGFLALTFHYGAPVFFIGFAGLCFALISYNVLRNPVSGVDFNARYLRAYSGRWEQRINTNEIAQIEIRKSDDDDLFAVHTRSGKRHFIPAACIGKTERFEATARALGITVKLS